MRRILFIWLIFSCSNLLAQPYMPTENRELPRGEVMPYASAADAAAGAEHHRFGATITEWSTVGTTFAADFTAPFAWTNRQVLVRIASASAEYALYINGRRVAFNADANTPADFNITKQVKEGRNRIEIRLAEEPTTAPLEGWKEGTQTPQLGRVQVLSSPTMGVRDVLTKCWRGKEEQLTNVEVAVVMKSYALNPRSARLYYELLNPQGEQVAQGHGDLTLRMRGEDTIRFLAEVPDTLLWSRTKPQWYTLRLRTMREGRVMEHHALPLGLRSVEVQEGKLVVNGQIETLQMAGIAPSASLEEVEVLRKTGANTLYLLPGADPERIYRMCDTLGMYVVAQTPIDTHHSGSSRLKGGTVSNDPAWKAAFIERAEHAYHTAKRHPSVIAFSLAHNSANGICLYESYLHMKQQADTRPMIYRDAEGEWNSDVLK
ncbi:MAG: hypothetical protein IJF77_01750 [Alistipes sp.]|nr:hypothetical protein [Alistipes sp.]